MSKLLTFGCSFTKYHWETWADHLGKQFDVFINHGRIGAGNQFILHKIVQMVTQGDITEKDTVVVMWTSVMRYDRFVKGKKSKGEWLTHGNVYGGNHSDEFIEKYVDPVGYFHRDCSFIQAAHLILESIGCKYTFLSMMPINNMMENYRCKDLKEFLIQDDLDRIYKRYDKVLSIIKPSVFEVVFNCKWNSRHDELNLSQTALNYEFIKGADWPTKEQWESGDILDINENIKTEICLTLGANSIEEVLYHKLWLQKDGHPTSAMHIEYLNTVLPDWETWR